MVAAGGAALAISAGSVAVGVPAASAAVSRTAAVTASHPTGAAVAAFIRAHRRAIARAAVEKSAQVIGITPAALVTALRGGQSLAQVAQAHGVQPKTVGDALIAAGDTKITALENAHKISAVRADRLRLRLDRVTAKLLTHHFR
jgi:hypothetical protein